MAKPNLSDIDLRLLRIFQAIVEQSGLTPAAYQLNISVPTISNHLSDLETRLGFTLCHRGRGGFSLTDEGREVYKAYISLSKELGQFSERMGEIGGTLVGTLRLGIVTSLHDLPDFPITKALQTFKDRSDQTIISLRSCSVDEIEPLVQNETIEIGITATEQDSALCNLKRLTSEHLSLYCGHGHPLFNRSVETISKDEVMEQERCYREYVKASKGRTEARSLRHTAFASDLEAVALLILSGRFIGYLPDHFAARWVQEGKMKPLLPKEFSYEKSIALVTKQGKPLSNIAKAFLQDLEIVSERK